MQNKCKICNYMNDKEALFCAECGEKMSSLKEKDAIVTDDSRTNGILAVTFVLLIVMALLVLDRQNKIYIPVSELKDINLSTYKNKIKNIKKKDTFESTDEFKKRVEDAVSDIPLVSIGKLIMGSYDADKETLYFSVLFDKEFKKYIHTSLDSSKSFMMYMEKAEAKELFSKEKTIKLYAKAKGFKSFTFFIAESIIVPLSFDTASHLLLNSKQIEDYLWEDHANMKRLTWQKAMDYCDALVLDGYSDWRLPKKEELKDLYAHKNRLTNGMSNFYWSSTTYAGYSDFAWIVDFDNGYQDGNDKTDSNYVRCVRAGQ